MKLNRTQEGANRVDAHVKEMELERIRKVGGSFDPDQKPRLIDVL